MTRTIGWPSWPHIGLLLLLCAAIAGCVNNPFSAPREFTMEGSQRLREAGPGVIRFRWVRALLLPHEGAYLPVEHASATLDARRDRIYQGTSKGHLYAFDSMGGRRLFYQAKDAIEAAPAIDSERSEIYVPIVDGTVLALDADTFELRWEENVGFGIRNVPVLADDAVYIVTETDQINALSRDDGTVLWTYRRPPGEEFGVSGQAGLTLVDGRIFTGFSDGIVVALDASDGSVLWEVDTSGDIEEVDSNRPSFSDVDTTPVVIDDLVYVASYAGGLYALSKGNGSVEWRDSDRKGVVDIAPAGPWLILMSATHGVTAYDREAREVKWRRPIERGSPTEAQVLEDRGIFFYGETRGSLLAVTVREGRELGRLDTGHGFSAKPEILGSLGAVLSNSGSLLVFRVPRDL